jgi:hypothetical protein
VPASVEELFAELTQLTTVSRSEFEHIASLPPDLQELALQNFRSMDWADPSTSAGQRALEILSALGSVGSAVGSVAGAIAGVKGL